MSYGIKKLVLLFVSFAKYIFYSLINFSIPTQKPKTNDNSILLIKVDEIGDYILFRNFLESLRNSKKYKNKKITLLGNKAWKSIFEKLDSTFVDESIWLDKNQFSKSIDYRKKFLENIGKTYHGEAVNCSFSRNFFLDDNIMSKVNAKNKIGFETDLATAFNWQRRISNNYYDSLIKTDYNHRFDFYKNKLLFEYLTGEQVDLQKPAIEIIPQKNPFIEYQPYVAFYIGAKQSYRRWNVEYFSELANFIIDKYNYNLLLLGASADKIHAQNFLKINNSEKVKNFTEKTSLLEIIKILHDAELFVSNDSGLAHISMAVQSKTIVLSNGSRYGRFFPYPKEITNISTTIFPEIIERKKDNPEHLIDKYHYTSSLNINSIKVNTVVEQADKFLSNH